ncbi:hypothetical protein RJT34_30888 [Clitoria ternatea]|uniref:BHLH domain-containing protein n=1 Tax=Clitoria ternatea TaxID=43366 RepID=A0AAN9EVC9_CLITE
MDASAANWLSDMEMKDYTLFQEQCPLTLLDVAGEEFLSHDHATSACKDQTQKHKSLSLSNSSSDETSFDFERPTKLLKTKTGSSSNSFTITKLSSSSSFSSSSQSQILSFDNPISPPSNATTQFYGFDCPLKHPTQNDMVSAPIPQLGNQHLSTQPSKGSAKNQNFEMKTSQGKRSPAQPQDHIMAERKRREKLNQSFIALAALIPDLKKMDKASVLENAIKYVKGLKERLAVLEEQSKKTRTESVVVLNKKEEASDDDDSSSCDESVEADESLFQVEAKVSGQDIMLRIHCQKQKGLLVKILAQIHSYRLSVVNSSVLPFGESILDITIIAQRGDGFNLTTKELVKGLRVAALKIMT